MIGSDAKMPSPVPGLKLATIRSDGNAGGVQSYAGTCRSLAAGTVSARSVIAGNSCSSPGNRSGNRGKAKTSVNCSTGDQEMGKNSHNKRVLGYAAVAAVRRSLEQHGTGGKAKWMASTRSVVNKARPGSEPAGCTTTRLGDSRRSHSVRGSSGVQAVVACSLEPATAMDDWSAEHQEQSTPSLLVFSGGTAFNGVVEEMQKLTTKVTHVLPVSDDGGSTSEILRVLGGPALGDIRSRCLRLSDESCSEALAVKRLLGYRLPLDSSEAKAEWYNIVEGEHELWNDVSVPYRETIRAYLVYFQTQILMHSKERFCFSNGSIGNFFFAGARIFMKSLDAAIFLYSRVSRIPADSNVLPAICTNDRVTLGCELYDGTFVRGQNEISHPTKINCVDDCHVVDKGKSTPPLPSPIKRIFYMSPDGTNASHEAFPTANPEVLKKIGEVDSIIYGMGSLYTSICPLLVLRGVGETIAKQTCPKLLLLNGSHDRETGGMSASDFIISICDALNRKYGDPSFTLDYPPAVFVNAVLVPRNGAIAVDKNHLEALGVTQVVVVDSIEDEKTGTVFDPKSLISCIERVIAKKNGLDKRKQSPTKKPS